MIDLIVKEELNRIEENYVMNIWTLNVIYYTTAVTLLKMKEIYERNVGHESPIRNRDGKSDMRAGFKQLGRKYLTHLF